MNTPICDFLAEYANAYTLRLHMPGHKGKGNLHNAEDITEISGADSLYEASGIIRESEKNASALFGAYSYYSTEGSSLAIRAMMYLVSIYAKDNGKPPLIAAGRNAHKTLISALALLGLDVDWLTTCGNSYLSCVLNATDVENYLNNANTLPAAIYLTSPDYLGNISDIRGIAKVCRENGVLLIVDNAHGAYLNFLPESLHPIALGADMCCDSAHKTLPVLTGGAYLHIAKQHESFSNLAKDAMSLFGSTSPSYLILSSLDEANKYMSEGYKEKLADFIPKLMTIKKRLLSCGYDVLNGEPMKITLATKSYGYLGTEVAEHLTSLSVVPEFADKDYIVLMPTPEILDDELERLYNALESLEKKLGITDSAPTPEIGERAMSIREAVMSPSELLPVDKCLNRILATTSVGCPPAVPIVVSGEVITQNSIECFKYYGIEKCRVVKG